MGGERLRGRLLSAVIVAMMAQPAWVQSAEPGSATRAADAYNRCISDAAAGYALRLGSQERLANKAARLRHDEKATLATAYIDEFLPNRATDEAAPMAQLFVDQIASAALEVARLDIIRLRIEAAQ